MTIFYPVPDLLDVVKWRQESFELRYRHEISRTAGGEMIAADLGTPIWVASWASVPLSDDELAQAEARLGELRGSIGTFLAWSLRRKAPIAHPDGVGLEAAAIKNFGSGRRVRLEGLVEGVKLTRGDLISWQDSAGYRLHRVLETRFADEDGETSSFEVAPRPVLEPSEGTPVSVLKASCAMRLTPGSVAVTPNGPFSSVVTFAAEQVLE